MAHTLNDAVFKFFLTVTDQHRQTTPSTKELTTPSVKNNSLGVVGRRRKLSIEVH